MVKIADDNGFKPQPQFESNRRIRKPKSNTKEKTIFHMGVFDIEAADDLRKYWHKCYLDSIQNRSSLIMCYEVLDNYFMVIENALADGIKKDLNEKMNRLDEDIYNTAINELAEEQYVELRRKIRMAMKKMYEAKQNAGLGIPKERMKDVAEKLVEALR